MSRYVARNEFFGCLIFDRENNNYIPFDSEATRFFRSGALREPTEEKEKRNFTDFVNSCKALGILDEREKFPHPWLDNRTNDDFLSAPLKISLNITSDCNLRCRHCYALAGGTDEKGMAFERLKHLVDEMARNGVFLLSIKGGEPFSHPALTETLEYAAEKGLTTTIITNGTLIAESEAKRLNDTSLAYITLSLDGADRRVHEYIRGKGTFARVLHSFELLKTHFRRPAFLYFTISKLNSHQIPEMFSLAARMNCDGIRFRPVLPVGRAVRHGDLLLGRQEYRESLQKIQELASDSSIGVDIPRSDSLCSDKETVINYDLYSNFGCIAGNTFIHVDPHGNLYPCQYLESPDFAAGNLFTSSLRHVWDTAPIFRVFRTFEGNPKCLSCELFANCKGGCRARPILFGDDMNAPDPWCSRAEE